VVVVVIGAVLLAWLTMLWTLCLSLSEYRRNVMSDVKRFVLEISGGRALETKLGDLVKPGHKFVHVREDRATETDIRAVALWMVDGREEQIDDGCLSDAHELLSLVFGEEASRGF
jgi:hypothetical protein